MVDLPQPDCPTKAIFFPLLKDRFRLLKIVVLLVRYEKAMFLNSMLPSMPVVRSLDFYLTCNCSSSSASITYNNLAADSFASAISGRK